MVHEKTDLFGSGQIVRQANQTESTHNATISLAAAKLAIYLAKKHLFDHASIRPSQHHSNQGSSSSHSSPKILSISAKGDEQASIKVDMVINHFLDQGHLTEKTKTWLEKLLDKKAPLKEALDSVTLTEYRDGKDISRRYYLPLREIFVIVYQALSETDESIWAIPKASNANDEQTSRLKELIKTLEALASSTLSTCNTGIRHSLLGLLNGYEGKRLPLNEKDLLINGIRDYFVEVIFTTHLNIEVFSDDQGQKNITEIQGLAFANAYQTIFWPWLQAGMPAKVIDAFNKAGGEDALYDFLIKRFQAIGGILSEQEKKRIKSYSNQDNIVFMHCDFTPFLSALQNWLTTHYFNNTYHIPSTTKLKNDIVNWLGSEALIKALADEDKPKGLDRFYLLERFFDALAKYQSNRFLLIQHQSLPEDQKPLQKRWQDALEYLSSCLANSELSLDHLFDKQDEFVNHITAFEQGFQYWRQAHYTDFISYYFAIWYDADDEQNIEPRAKLFTTLANLYFNEQQQAHKTIFIDDGTLETWLSSFDETQKVPLEVYQINRMLLHALCYSPEQWSETFRHYLQVVFNFIKNNFNEPQRQASLDLAQSSYPNKLMTQLESLIDNYDDIKEGREPKAIMPFIITPQHITPDNTLVVTQYIIHSPSLVPALIEKIVKQRGFDVSAADSKGWTPLLFAAAIGHLDMMKVLISEGADINHRDNDGDSPAHIAAFSGQVDVLRALHKCKADLSLASNEGIAPAHAAAHEGHVEVLRVLNELGVDLNISDETGLTPAHFAALKGHVEVLRMLNELGVDLNISDKIGYTPAHFAALKGHVEVLRELNKLGADLNLSDKNGCTPARIAALKGHVNVLRVLNELGVDLNLSDKTGVTSVKRLDNKNKANNFSGYFGLATFIFGLTLCASGFLVLAISMINVFPVAATIALGIVAPVSLAGIGFFAAYEAINSNRKEATPMLEAGCRV